MYVCKYAMYVLFRMEPLTYGGSPIYPLSGLYTFSTPGYLHDPSRELVRGRN